ncbi:MAG: N-acetyltransferase [Planctomycetes bacterium]|nr:N-acetyltransferase [Planctomycetota bacterium]
MIIRPEAPDDVATIRAVNEAAFETPAEAALVNALRGQVQPFISLVAERDGRVIGHILFTPVEVVGDEPWAALALGPMAVLPELQKQGIGSQLVHAGLQACRSGGHDVVFVLGHPTYYPRFGFRRMSEFGITCEFKAPDDVLMVTELALGAIAGRKGEVRYHPLFKTV